MINQERGSDFKCETVCVWVCMTYISLHNMSTTWKWVAEILSIGTEFILFLFFFFPERIYVHSYTKVEACLTNDIKGCSCTFGP